MTAIIKRFNGRTYTLYITRVGKNTAEKEAKNLRKQGLKTRLYRESDGKYDIYIGQKRIRG